MQGARVFQSPKYVQQAGVLAHVGDVIRATLPGACSRPCLITSPRLRKQYGAVLTQSLATPLVVLEHSGECSRKNVARLLAQLESSGSAPDHVICFGAGKLMDITKLVAAQLGLPVIILPSLASTDAPCLGASIVYTDDGEYEACDFTPRSPDLVIVDPTVIAAAPVQYLVAGMGDAMATQYEASACADNPAAFTWMAGGASFRPPLIAAAIGRACLDTLYEHGVAAKADCAAQRVTPALEAVVEANTLLSGLGAESGGLAVAHGFHNALTALPEAHHCMHGEKVAFGTMVHLLAQGREGEARRVAAFNAAVGLPTTLSDLGVVELSEAKLQLLVDKTLCEGSISWNLAGVTAQAIRGAIVAADALGRQLAVSEKAT